MLGYIGGGMIVTWPEKAGSTGGRPLHCFCEMRAALQRSHKRFRQEFQSIPEVRGSLHFGSLIVGETGALKRAIVFNGDVMNTAARLEESSRFVEGGFVASHTAIQHFKGVLPCRLTSLGYLELRGRTQTVEAYGLGRRPATGTLPSYHSRVHGERCLPNDVGVIRAFFGPSHGRIPGESAQLTSRLAQIADFA